MNTTPLLGKRVATPMIRGSQPCKGVATSETLNPSPSTGVERTTRRGKGGEEGGVTVGRQTSPGLNATAPVRHGASCLR